jgi:hypothetical protein
MKKILPFALIGAALFLYMKKRKAKGSVSVDSPVKITEKEFNNNLPGNRIEDPDPSDRAIVTNPDFRYLQTRSQQLPPEIYALQSSGQADAFSTPFGDPNKRNLINLLEDKNSIAGQDFNLLY